jgi:hypothetical protein
MVRVKGPMFSLSASGTIGKTATFSNWKGRDYVRRHAIPSNPRSGLQVGVRSVFGFISQDYKNLLPAQKADWAGIAANTDITPLNAQQATDVDRARRNLGWQQDLTAVNPASIDAPTAGAAAAQPKTLIVTWTDPAANKPDYCYAIYSSTVTGFTPDISNLIAVVKFGTNTYTHRNLVTGTPYYYRIRGLSKSGFLGTLEAQFTGTPT